MKEDLSDEVTGEHTLERAEGVSRVGKHSGTVTLTGKVLRQHILRETFECEQIRPERSGGTREDRGLQSYTEVLENCGSTFNRV